MRPSWSMHVSAVVGSLTAGEIAFKAMSTICKIPSSTSCCMVRAGPMSKARRQAARRVSVTQSAGDASRMGVPAITNCPM
jgi:hypothetical protein